MLSPSLPFTEWRSLSFGLGSRLAALFELNTGTARLLPLEGLRGMSAGLVFFVHFYALFGSLAPVPLTTVFRFLSTLGHCGVDVFFALSGYIIYSMLMNKPGGYLRFVKRRLIRLYPAFTAVFLLYLGISIVLPQYSKLQQTSLSAPVYLLLNFLMLPGIVPIVPMITVAWSLSYELFFYLTLPLLVRWLRINEWTRPLRIGLFLALAGACFLPVVPGIGSHPRLSMFVCGILVAETSAWRFRWPRAGASASLALFAGFLTLFGVEGMRNDPGAGATVWMPPPMLLALFASVYGLVHFSLDSRTFLSNWFAWNYLRWFGNFSYSYYLIHGFVLHAVAVAVERIHPTGAAWSGLQFLALLGVSFASTVVGAAVLFLAVEKPFSLAMQTSRQRRSIPAEGGQADHEAARTAACSAEGKIRWPDAQPGGA